MRTGPFVSASVGLLLILVGSVQSQSPGKLAIYDATENTGPVICTQGDLLQISFSFNTEPKAQIANLKVEIEGNELTEIGVFTVPVYRGGKTSVFDRNISAFFRAQKAGRPVVVITQLDPKGEPRGKPREFKIVIAKSK